MPPIAAITQPEPCGRPSGNWRVVFRFEDNEAVDVDLVDYH